MSRDEAELTAPLDEDAFYAGDPFPHLARLRHEAPIAWNPATGYWALSRWDDVMSVSKDSATFCSGRGILTFEIGVEYPSPPTMMHTDPPSHTRYRKLVQPAFAPGRIRALEPRLRTRIATLLDAITPGEPFDFMDAVAIPLPIQVIAELLGVAESDGDRFFLWSEASVPGVKEWDQDENTRLQAEMNAYLLDAARTRRADPRDDLISTLATVEVDGEQLADEELQMFLVQLLVAGNETTRNAMGTGVVALARHPEQWQQLRDDRSLLDSAVEEILRWSTPVIYFMRTATRDTELSGCPIAAGDPVVMLYASANRDEDQFGPTADRFDIARAPNHHVAFGFGTHFCIGAALARLELRLLLEEMLDRFSTIILTGPVELAQSMVIAGVKHAPVVCS